MNEILALWLENVTDFIQFEPVVNPQKQGGQTITDHSTI